jgi:peptide/nickel transport system substrate-binding protein
MGPIPEAGSDPASYKRHPLATGPYEVATYHPKQLLRLVRNPEWDPDTDPGRHNYPDEFRFLFGQDTRRTADALLADKGQAQTSLTWNDDVLTSDTNRVMGEASDRLTSGPGPCSTFLALDYRKITDVLVRKAVGYAFPYEEVNLVGGISPIAHPITTLLAPQIPGRIDYSPLSTQPGQTDPAAARAALRQAGYDPGEYTLTFAYQADDPVSVTTKNVFAAAFEAGGFDAHPFRTSSLDQYNAVRDDRDAPINIRSTVWCLDWPSGGGSVIPLLTPQGGPGRWGTYFDEPTVDAEVDRIAALPLGEQPAAWGELDRTIESMYYPIVMRNNMGKAMLHGSRVGGMNDDSLFGMPTWKDLYVIR